jgi:hypothetical protein
MAKYFVKVPMIIGERGSKADLNTPGGDKWLKKLNGEQQGLPYFGFFSAKGKVLGTAKRPDKDGKIGRNIGHPVRPPEVAYFMTLVRKAAPKMTDKEAKVLSDYLNNQKI